MAGSSSLDQQQVTASAVAASAVVETRDGEVLELGLFAEADRWAVSVRYRYLPRPEDPPIGISAPSSGDDTVAWYFSSPDEAAEFFRRLRGLLETLPTIIFGWSSPVGWKVRFKIGLGGWPIATVMAVVNARLTVAVSDPCPNWAAAKKWADQKLRALQSGDWPGPSTPDPTADGSSDGDAYRDGCYYLVGDERPELTGLGADPEFELVVNGKIAPAYHFYESTDAEIGADGSGCQVEFRPWPGLPEELVENFRQLLRQFLEEQPYFRLCAKGDKYPLGGHIHIGLRGSLSDVDAATMIEAIDHVVGQTLALSGDARGDYRQRAAWRRQPHGLEYRTPPAAVWSDPDVALAVLKVVWHIASELCRTGMFDPSTFRLEDVLDSQDLQAWNNLFGRRVWLDRVLHNWLQLPEEVSQPRTDQKIQKVRRWSAGNRAKVQLPGVREGSRLVGFGIWWDNPNVAIPISNVVKYTLRQYRAGREWYDVVLEFPDGALEAWEGQSGVILWDDYRGEKALLQGDIFYTAYDPLAALFMLLSWGAYRVVGR